MSRPRERAAERTVWPSETSTRRPSMVMGKLMASTTQTAISHPGVSKPKLIRISHFGFRISFHLHRPGGTYLSARIATRTEVLVDDMLSVRGHGNGIDGATLGAKCAPGARVEDFIFDQRGTFAGGT